jgi:hypothetical protein
VVLVHGSPDATVRLTHEMRCSLPHGVRAQPVRWRCSNRAHGGHEIQFTGDSINKILVALWRPAESRVPECLTSLPFARHHSGDDAAP